jgi:hypothetical protein
MMVWNARVRFVEFPGSAEFLARIRQSTASPESIEFPLVDERRGLELSKSYGFNINFFAQYRQREYVKGVLLAELRNLGSEFDLTQGSGKVRELLIHHKKPIQR